MPETKTAQDIPTKIGEFDIIRKVDEGGLAEIYLARQKSLNRKVAIKILLHDISNDPDFVKRFDRESITLAMMSHPNIVHIIDRGEENGRLYFAMEYIEGTTFREILDNGDWSLERKLGIIIQVLKALDYAHKNGVIHRDIKPSNILIDHEENALIADFGIAQLLESESKLQDESGMVMGTYAYMSPEQKEDSSLVDHTTDIYAVGVMLYETLAGVKPLGKLIPPSEVNPALPYGYDHVVEKALQYDPHNRYQKAVEMKDDLLAVLHSSDGAMSNKTAPTGKVKSFIGNCSFLDTLKDGTYGSTYLVEDRTSRGLYVIKKQNKPDVGLKEAKLMANLRHPNILTVHGAGGDENKLVLVMDYAQGGSLSDRLVKPMQWREAIKLMRQITAGMDFAHKNNIIHGNLRPSNILFDRDDVVKIADFALMPHYDKNAVNWYAAPERRKSKLGDIYSAGIIFYQLLTNRVPTFDTYGKFVWIEGNRITSPELKVLVDKMIRTLASERIQTFAEVEEILCRLDEKVRPARTHDLREGHREDFKKYLPYALLFSLCFLFGILYLFGIIHF